MRRAVLIAILLLPNLAFAQDTKKRPIPSKDAQAKIEALLQELYQDDFAKAQKDASLRSRLAQTLLSEGRDTKDDAAGRYVLFSKAHALAAQAGDVTTAFQAIDELAGDFAIPPATIFQMKIAMLQQASTAMDATPDAYRAVIDRALAILEETLEADDYPSSLALIAAAEQAGRRLKSIATVSALRKKQDDIVRREKEYARWKPFADRLAKNPKDAQASQEMGKYYALVKGDWERGLPLLAAGEKGALRNFAAEELKEDPPALALGEAWLEYGLGAEPSLKAQALLHAYSWFQESYPSAEEEQKPRIDNFMKRIAAALPPEYRIGEIRVELKKLDLPGPVYGCAISGDGKRVLATGYDGAVRLINARTYKEIRTLDGHAGKVWTVAVSPDGKHAVTGGFDNSVRLWDLSTGLNKLLQGHKDYVRSVQCSADGKWILSGGDDRTVRLWNASTGTQERVLPGHDHTVWCVAIFRDGKRGLSASLDKTVRYWDLEKGELIRKLEGHADTVLAVAFTPDGRRTVTGSSDKTMRLWDLDTGKTIRTFEGSTGYILSVAISPDGRRILSAGADGAVRLWDAESGKELRKLEGHRDQVWHVAFSRDGRFALSSGQDFSVRFWAGAR